MIDLKNKIVIVTGGNGLLGSRIITEISNWGGTAINIDINGAASQEHFFSCDTTNEAAIAQCVKQVHERYGCIDGLVNNAYPRTSDWGKKWEDIPADSWKSNVDMQLNGYYLFAKEVLKYMKVQKSGSVVNMSSIYGVVGPDFSVYDGTEMTMPAAYAAIKGGLINLSRYMATYFGKDNIRVNCISPGGIFNEQPESFVKRYEERTPLGRMGTPDDIAPGVCYLLSDAASYVSGQNLIIDGGWTAK